MAGEFQEPFNISFLTESLHSGSISFGRFENEPLAWERRSSFSHNRYLEEVEKFSKPGSVIEKKAYFEAHFRKKALLLQGSSEGQTGGEDQTCENDAVENEGYREYQLVENHAAENKHSEEGSDSLSKDSHCDHFGENGLDNADYREDFCCGNGNEGNQSGDANEGSLCAHFDNGLEDSKYHTEGALIECGLEYPGGLYTYETHVLVPRDVKPEESPESEIGCDTPLFSNDKPDKKVEENHDDNAVSIDESFKSKNPSPCSGTTGEVDPPKLEIRQNHSPKLKPAIVKATKPRLKSPSPDHSRKNISSDPSKVAARILERKEKEINRRTKAENLPLRTATPTRRLMHRSPNKEDSERDNAKLNTEHRSEKGAMAKRVIEARPSLSKKIEPVAHQTPNRLKQTISSTKADVKLSAGAFQFKSDERAFSMKVEEKMHSKEVEMNQIQARKQEKTEAEIKQLRKSLNFKAKPMPSFYHVATAPRSNGNKAASSTIKPAKVLPKAASPGVGATVRSPPLSKQANKEVFSTGGPVEIERERAQ
ncbi:hypothetical protein ERO13_A03G121700v2 [Gossypium hirsutum]|uniref:Protein WVD2-like 7 isoform X2 n=3 Tax=Gossypium TaxID=3633 RepID=A0ABM3AEF7_GOSHI|nr:protein WVD2-like 7 isoform X2 [Gossypium hirsutum]KAG4208287.1 hypothetical protein ERO13_A03G121700v2 [Gossypium hirsutum]TYI36555.1 hypothetical protein ES332_A03G149300v1 [Gossypium tomentosum]TYJ43210.1 hypothetical protein E1A91_A03G138300v1 [Gossypium mustelinum]